MYKIRVEFFKNTEKSGTVYIKGMLTCIICDENSTYHDELIFEDPMEDYPVDCYERRAFKTYTTGHFPNNEYGLEELNADLNRMLKEASKAVSFRRKLEKQNNLNLISYDILYKEGIRKKNE